MFLNEKRLAYAFVAGLVLWSGWLGNMLAGRGFQDHFGKIIGPDFVCYYVAGHMVAEGQANKLYDDDRERTEEEKLFGVREDFVFTHAHTPPLFAAIFVPFAQIPYLPSFFAWTATGLLGLWQSLRWLKVTHPIQAMAWLFTWIPVFSTVTFGQNGFLSFFLLTLVYTLWNSGSFWKAGIVSAGFFYKPHLLIGIIFLWFLEWRKNWKALAGLFATSLVLVLLHFLLFREATISYLLFIKERLPLETYAAGFPYWHAYSFDTFWFLLMGRGGAQGITFVLSILTKIIALAGFLVCWRRYRLDSELLFSYATILSFCLTPRVMVYDLVVLLLPVFLWRRRMPKSHSLKILFAGLWIAHFLSGVLVQLQMRYWPFALHVGVLAFWGGLLYAYKTIIPQLALRPIR